MSRRNNFGENIYYLLICWRILEGNQTFQDLLPSEMTIYINVLDSLVKHKILAILKAEILSQERETSFKLTTPNSPSNRTSHVILEAMVAMALYSASEDDLDTVPCLLDFQIIGEEPRRMT